MLLNKLPKILAIGCSVVPGTAVCQTTTVKATNVQRVIHHGIDTRNKQRTPVPDSMPTTLKFYANGPKPIMKILPGNKVVLYLENEDNPKVLSADPEMIEALKILLLPSREACQDAEN